MKSIRQAARCMSISVGHPVYARIDLVAPNNVAHSDPGHIYSISEKDLMKSKITLICE